MTSSTRRPRATLRRPGLLLASLLVAALPGCATTFLWYGASGTHGRFESWDGATGGRAWCVAEADAFDGWPEPAAVAPGSRPLYVVELTFREGRTTTAWVATGAVGDGPARGEAVARRVEVPRHARPVALRTLRSTADGRAADLLVVDGDVAFVVSATASRWVADDGAGETATRVLLTPLAVSFDLATLPLQLPLLAWLLLAFSP